MLTHTGLVFERGREAYLRKLEAEALMLESQAQKEAVSAAKESFELQKNQMDYVLDVANKFEAPEIRDQLKKRIQRSIDRLFLGNENYVQRRMLSSGAQSVSVSNRGNSEGTSSGSYDLHTLVAGAALQPGKPFPLRCNCGGVAPILPPINTDSVTCPDCGAKIRLMILKGDPGYLMGQDPKTGREFLFQAQGSTAPSSSHASTRRAGLYHRGDEAGIGGRPTPNLGMGSFVLQHLDWQAQSLAVKRFLSSAHCGAAAGLSEHRLHCRIREL